MTRILVTGGAGYLGSRLLERLAPRVEKDEFDVVAVDVREVTEDRREAGIDYLVCDVRDPALGDLLAEHESEVVIHLAAIVDPPPDMDRDTLYSIDVGGAENVLAACLQHGVRRLIVTSSGAAYGYYADHPEWIDEEQPLRGNEEFAYAKHKHIVEERLAVARTEHPTLEQVVLRVGTILGENANNRITNLFDKKRLLGIRGGDDRFVFIWDEDVAACLEYSINAAQTGIFNVAGDGALSMGELAQRMGKPYLRLPPWLVIAALTLGKPLGLTRYGPEEVRFVRYRPVLANQRLKEEFGFVPRKTSSEVYDLYLASRDLARRD